MIFILWGCVLEVADVLVGDSQGIADVVMPCFAMFEEAHGVGSAESDAWWSFEFWVLVPCVCGVEFLLHVDAEVLDRGIGGEFLGDVDKALGIFNAENFEFENLFEKGEVEVHVGVVSGGEEPVFVAEFLWQGDASLDFEFGNVDGDFLKGFHGSGVAERIVIGGWLFVVLWIFELEKDGGCKFLGVATDGYEFVEFGGEFVGFWDVVDLFCGEVKVDLGVGQFATPFAEKLVQVGGGGHFSSTC